ncbi:RNA polymerase sigma factor [Sphingomicrobium lutaoense]|uniref:RNA polymerase sigma-70 factor (ECF subfamily) n=1 Tax=Sphingomicrobium lutaoense TaxID=515949 RepID=A0A839Z1S9_9SPHN|nr:RNA polymerase sigma factor [Sphingomicrobium lutaoense]MBB3764610.1 RNA polymerase sigma-70 factor (ECF subfamily) [Sphingomicrobium lutaoense]
MNLLHADFEAALTEVYPRLRRFAYGLTSQAADADDLVQRACERAMRKSDRFEPGTRFDSWMFRLTRNLWIDTVRASSRRASREIDAEAGKSVGYDPRPATEAAIDLSTALEAMGHLPEEQREVVALILIDGMGYRETAELLDLPIGTVSSRLVRGRKALMELLGEKDDD